MLMPFEFIVGAVVGGAAVSRRVRQAVRKGLIYGVGGALVAYDKVAAMAHGVRNSVHKATATAGNAQATADNAQAKVPVTPAPAPEATPQNVSANTPTPVGTPP
jgi:hypothetical protein